MFYTPVDAQQSARLVKRPDTPHLYIYWYCQKSRRIRRRSTGTSNVEEARQLLMQVIPESAAAVVPRGTPLPQPATTSAVPLLGVISEYVERKAYPRGHPSRVALDHWIRFCESQDVVYASELTLDAQEQYISWRRTNLKSKGCGSNATINRELSVARAALRAAWRRGRLPSAQYVTSLPKPPPRSRFLTPDECHRLLNACDDEHLRRFVMLALHTVQRPKAILDLRVEQVSLDRARIDFAPPGHVQSNKRRPVVPITASLRPMLEDAIRTSGSGYVVEFLGQPVKSVKRSFQTACRKAGLDDVSPYTLRHTGATLLAAAGVSMRQVAGMLGHTTMHTTEMYAKHAPEFLQHAASTLDSLFGPRPMPEHRLHAA